MWILELILGRRFLSAEKGVVEGGCDPVNPARDRGEASPGSDVVYLWLSCGKLEVLLAHIWCALCGLEFCTARYWFASLKMI